MTPDRLLRTAILPACAELEGSGVKNSPAAHRFMLAIALQESGLRHRRQVSADGTESGPASSFWQGEKNGVMILDNLLNPKTAKITRIMCDKFNVTPEKNAIWQAIQYQDILAAILARLAIHKIPHALPETLEDGWAQYEATWAPGKPHREGWDGCWHTANDLLKVAA